MKNNYSKLLLGFALVLLLTGCATVPKEAGFDDVQQQVEQRTGRRVHWNQGTAEDEAVAESVRTMLADALTWEQAVQIALLNNRRLQATYADLGVAQAAVVQAGLLKNPIFDAAISFPLAGTQPEYDLALVMDFLDVFFIPLRKAIAEADFEGTKLGVTAVVLDFAGQTRAAFYDAQANQEALEMRQQVMAAVAASFNLAKRLHKAGNIHDLDLALDKALYEQAKLDLATNEATLLRSREHLNTLMGVWGKNTNWKIAGRLMQVPEQSFNIENLEKRAIESSLDLAIARQQIISQAQQLGLTKAAAFVPDIEVGGLAEREEGEWEAGVGFALPIPLFDQGQARIATARSQLHSRREHYAALAVEIRSAVRAARDRLLAARRNTLHYRNILLPLQKLIVDKTLLQYNAMTLGPFRLLAAKQQQIDTGRRYIRSLHEYWLARTELEQILQGRLSNIASNQGNTMSESTASAGNEGGH